MLCLFCIANGAHSDDHIEITVPKARSIFDMSHDYHVQLLMFALDKSGDFERLPKINETYEMSIGRAELELARGENIDVYWLGSSLATNHQIRPIMIPTTRGVIGFRMFLANKSAIPKLDKVKSLDDLKHLKACQGAHWSDTTILRTAGLDVVTSPEYETLFKMLNGARCDYFPRGYHDYHSELSARKGLYPNIVGYPKIMLHYPFAVYFYTNQNNEKLAQSIEKGMHKMAISGELLDFMRLHPLTADMYPIEPYPELLFLSIDNPTLPLGVDYTDPIYWTQISEFKTSSNVPK